MPTASRRKLATRDYINVGIFTGLYFAVISAVGLIGFLNPVFMFLGWAVGILFGGVVLALFVARTPTFGAMTLLGLINGILFLVPGNWWPVAPISALLGMAADAILASGPAATRARRFPLAHAVFTLWFIVPLLPIVINGDAYYEDLRTQMSPEYVDAMQKLFQNWVLGVWTLCLLTLGYLGGLWGVRVTAKHFARSGLA